MLKPDVNLEDVEAIFKHMMDYCAPTEMAALAVLANHVRQSVEEDIQFAEEQANPERKAQGHTALYLFDAVERVAIASLQSNSGNVVGHIGTAAKQMNPLLS